LLALAGCHVDEHKNGDSDNVKIETPFGGLQVKTNDAAVLADIGLPAYPGAQPEKKRTRTMARPTWIELRQLSPGGEAASYLTPTRRTR